MWLRKYVSHPLQPTLGARSNHSPSRRVGEGSKGGLRLSFMVQGLLPSRMAQDNACERALQIRWPTSRANGFLRTMQHASIEGDARGYCARFRPPNFRLLFWLYRYSFCGRPGEAFRLIVFAAQRPMIFAHRSLLKPKIKAFLRNKIDLLIDRIESQRGIYNEVVDTIMCIFYYLSDLFLLCSPTCCPGHGLPHLFLDWIALNTPPIALLKGNPGKERYSGMLEGIGVVSIAMSHVCSSYGSFKAGPHNLRKYSGHAKTSSLTFIPIRISILHII